jgi:iron complex outermembrane receptor protein
MNLKIEISIFLSSLLRCEQFRLYFIWKLHKYNCNSLAIKGFMNRWLLAFILLSLDAYAHEAKLDDIEVVEHEDAQGLVDFIPAAIKLKGPELNKRRQTSLGDTLSSEAGVQSTSFGPSAGRPVVRGLDGDRIKILQNSLGTLDASTQSLDHAIPVDTLTIDQVELVRGPMSLLYGSSAVGGVVNLVTNRIHYEYEEGFFSKFLTQGETVNNGISNALHLNYGKKKWMFHVDGSTRNLGDQEIPGYARSSKARQVSPQASEDKDKLPNSFNKQDNIAVAASRIIDRGYYGLSFNHFNTNYGSVAEQDVTIDMTQNRFEFHGEYRPEGGLFRKLKLKSAQSDYFHREFAGGVTGTIFRNSGNETRLEGLNKSGKLNGITGIQSQIFTFEAKGEEAFLPNSDNAKLALFTFQQLSLGKNALRFGARLENQQIEKKSSEKFVASDEKGYLGINGSLGHCYDFSKTHTLETSLSYTERAPTFQELFANGDHVATGIFEQGDSQLVKEKAQALEVTYKITTPTHQFSASVYTQMFKDYIALTPTGVPSDESGFEINDYNQVDALFYGFDLDNRSEIKKLSSGSLFLINKFDFIRAKNTDSGANLPRISPPRLTAGLEFASDKWSHDVEVMYVAQQTKTAPTETRTDAYALTNLGTTYHMIGNLAAMDVFLRVRNLFDVEARSHVSTLKDIAPLPGRNIILGAQFQM